LGKNGKGRYKEVKYLLSEGANPNAETKDGVSMLHYAIRNRHYDCVKVLLDADANIKAKIKP
jgi:cytochrome c